MWEVGSGMWTGDVDVGCGRGKVDLKSGHAMIMRSRSGK
jgi:hypothetical protein